MGITPNELAEILGVDPKRMRGYLRSVYRPNGEDFMARWYLDYEMALGVARYFGKSLRSGPPHLDPDYRRGSDEPPAKRKYFDNIEVALSEFGLAVANQALAREVASRIEHSATYIPQPNQPYVALVQPDGRRTAATIHKGYARIRGGDHVDLTGIGTRNDSWWTVEFPENSVRPGGTHQRRAADAEPNLCRPGQHQLPATGVCDYCND